MADKLSVLRECRRVLVASGRMVGYLIHTPEGLDAPGMSKAGEIGPSFATLDTSPVDLLASAGFRLEHTTDVTAEFRRMLVHIRETRARNERQLRLDEGDAAYEEAQDRKRLTLQAVDEGLLVRSLWAAERVD